ncbi:nucleoporin Nup43 [Euwallacea fornicatus]|uniref:nucleoporin Nup43 n=1 Tax=Euwallacea fornicatus TaxID=995702 RepID=UPI00338FD0A5
MFSDRSSMAMSHNLHGTFISQKVNKIRWKPERIDEAHFFVTGSVDNEINKLTLWDLFENQEEEDIYPFTVSEFSYCGDVTEIKFLDYDHFACSSSSGSAHLMKVAISEVGQYSIENYTEWKDIHHFKNGESSPCTALATHENDVVTVGEDGRINVLTAQSADVVRSIDHADSCSIQCIIFLKHNEILTSNLRGQMKIWDLRSGNKPSGAFMLSGDQVTATYLTFHPTQRHIIIAGDELGALTTWDLRQNTYPVNVLNAHEGSIMEIQFHPDNPDNLLSCSSAGEIWHWFTKTKSRYPKKGEAPETNVWLAPENVKNKMDVLTLMPTLGKSINSLDLNRNKVICGCDNEAIYLINGITIQ